MEPLNTLVTHLLALDAVATLRELDAATARNDVFTVADTLVTPALEEIGRRWERGEAALSQVYMSARLCQRWIDKAPPATGATPAPVRVGVALLQDQHALGKQLVLMALHAAGFAPLDLGRGNAEELFARAREHDLQVLMISVLMLSAALEVRTLRTLIDEAGSPLQLVVGGAPFRFDHELGERVGAHGVGQTSSDAIALARHHGGVA